jgi:hypothetical protein
MRDPRFICRKLLATLPLSTIDLVCREINKLETYNSTIRILDLGSGSAWYWEKILARVPNSRITLSLMDSVEIEGPYSSNEKHVISRILGLVPTDIVGIEENSFEIVVAFDLIEHLTKEQGYQLLYEVDRISRCTNIFFSPNGFVWQPPSINNPFNAHISGWTPHEFRKLGFSHIQGHSGPKFLRGPYSQPKKWIKSWVLLELDALATILTCKLPRMSFAFSAVKRIKNPRITEQMFS